MHGVAAVVAVLEAVVLRNGGGVDQVHGIAVIHQPIDQPVPVAGRLHRHADPVVPIGRQVSQSRRGNA
jgi:hypothetical protein